MPNELKAYIAKGESVRQIFLPKTVSYNEIAQLLVSFANSEGGRLWIGLKKNGKIIGCDPNEELLKLQESAKSFCKPEMKFTSKIWKEDFRLVLEIKVSEADTKPYKSKDKLGTWLPYIRVQKEVLLANKILVGLWVIKKNPVPKPTHLQIELISLLQLIKEEQIVTLSKLYRLSDIPLKEVDRFLILLISWEMVDMVMNSDTTQYQISK
jgi:hypothetical protein